MRVLSIFCFSILSVTSARGQTKIPKETRSYIRNCADSINKLNFNEGIPRFLYYPCLDYQNNYWINLHHPLPLRKLIMDKVTNRKAIEFILSNYNDTLDKPCRPCAEAKEKPVGLTYYTLPLLKESFADLLRNRLYELEYR